MTKNNKTIGIQIRFWTNDLNVSNQRTKEGCWDSGVMSIEVNDSKGIKQANPVPFNSIEDITPLIKQLLRKNKILLVSDCSKARIERR